MEAGSGRKDHRKDRTERLRMKPVPRFSAEYPSTAPQSQTMILLPNQAEPEWNR